MPYNRKNKTPSLKHSLPVLESNSIAVNVLSAMMSGDLQRSIDENDELKEHAYSDAISSIASVISGSHSTPIERDYEDRVVIPKVKVDPVILSKIYDIENMVIETKGKVGAESVADDLSIVIEIKTDYLAEGVLTKQQMVALNMIHTKHTTLKKGIDSVWRKLNSTL